MHERGPNDAPRPPAGPSKRNRDAGRAVLIVAAVAIAVIVAIGIKNIPDTGTTGSGAGTDATQSQPTDTIAQASTATATTPDAVPSVVVSDNPAFDLTGSGDACRMHYSQINGNTATTFTLTLDGEMITHVSGPDGLHRNDQKLTRGVSAFTYDFPLGQATDMGAMLYLPDGTSQSCTISSGAGAP